MAMRPYTPFAVTLDKLNGQPAPTWVNAPTMRRARLQPKPKQLMKLSSERSGIESLNLEADGEAFLPQLNQSGGLSRQHELQHQRTSTPELFNHLSLDREDHGRWIVDFIEQDIVRKQQHDGGGSYLGGSESGSGGSAAQQPAFAPACERLVQLLGKGMGTPPLHVAALVELLEEQAAECARRQDFTGAYQVDLDCRLSSARTYGHEIRGVGSVPRAWCLLPILT